MSFWIATDACCDLPAGYIEKQRDLYIVPMSYQIEGHVHEIRLTDHALPDEIRSFYRCLQEGQVATTFQVTQNEWVENLSPILEQGNDLLVLVFSSSLSGMYLTAKAAENELKQKYPERKLFIFDTRSASMGEGLLVHYALQYRDAGHTIEETYQWVQDNAIRVIHWFTVTDLHFLHRGGRLSATSAYLGTILNIKPVLNVDPLGRLLPRVKVQGRKRSLKELYEKTEQDALEPDKQMIFISHGDSEEDAQWLAERLKKKLHVPEIMISQIGPIIGSHSGPGTVAVFFLDKDGSARLDAPEIKPGK
ncbi:MAG: DegV family protein [Eubacteriales bacterium]|nr:DegV family protein [Eubacteriales bacterium]